MNDFVEDRFSFLNEYPEKEKHTKKSLALNNSTHTTQKWKEVFTLDETSENGKENHTLQSFPKEVEKRNNQFLLAFKYVSTTKTYGESRCWKLIILEVSFSVICHIFFIGNVVLINQIRSSRNSVQRISQDHLCLSIFSACKTIFRIQFDQVCWPKEDPSSRKIKNYPANTVQVKSV